MNNRLNEPGVSLWPSLNSCFFSQFPYDILSQKAQKFNLLCSDSPLVGSHFEKENLKGSCDHVIPLWGEEYRLKSQQDSDIVLLCVYFLSN